MHFIAALVLTFAQDTVAETRLERCVTKDWDVFVEIDGVEAFVGGYDKSATKKVFREVRKAMVDAGAGDVLVEFQKEVGLPLEEFVGLVKGQLAFAADVPMTFAALAECRDADAAKKLGDLASKGTAAVKIDGRLVWVTSSKDMELKPAVNPLAEEALFKKARTLAGAAKGGLFAYVDLTAVLPLAGLMNEEFKKTGFAGLRAAATSLRFDAARVSQTHVFIGPSRPQGLLGTLMEMKSEKFSLAACPRSTALRICFSGEGSATALKLLKQALPDMPAMVDLVLDPILKDAGPFGVIVFTADGGHVIGLEGKAAAKALEGLVEMLSQMGVPVTKESAGGATLGELTMGDESPIGAYGIKGDRVLLAKSRKQIEAGLAASAESMEADYKPLLEGATFEGALLMIHDYTKYRDVIASLVAGSGHEDEKEMKVVDSVLGLAGKNVEWIGVRDGALVVESRSTSGLSLVTTAALAIPAIAKARDQAMGTSCSVRFHRLSAGLTMHDLDTGRYPAETGSALWEALKKDGGKGPYVEGDVTCAKSGKKLRGPTSDVNALDGDAIIGACDHGDEVILLRRNGTLQTVPAESDLAKRALKETKE